MTYSAAQGRQQILDALALAAQEIGVALAELSEAYEHLDERTAERLEEQLFQPVQAAYGRTKSVCNVFAERSGLAGAVFESPSQVAPSSSAKGSIERAVEGAAKAERALGELQDSMLPVEVGDPALRSGLAEIRQLLDPLRSRARELVRTVGR